MTQLYETPDLPVNDNGHRVIHRLRTDDNTTGLDAPATGLSVTAFLAATPQGAAIGGTSIALAEYPSKPGTYFGVIGAAALEAALLPTYLDQVVYEVVTCAGYRAERRFIVRDERLPGGA